MERDPAAPQRRASDDGRRERRERLRRDRALFERYRDPSSPVDREAIVRRFLPLARQLAARYAQSSEPFDDLFQVACLGLVNAVDRFETDRGTAFSSYAVPTILGELRRHFRDKTWSIRVPRDLQELGLGVQRESDRLTTLLGRSPTVDEIADAVGATRAAVVEARDALRAYHAGSLEEPCAAHGDDAPLLAALGTSDGGYANAEQRVVLNNLLRCLTHRERLVVVLRFENDMTQSQIAERVGISQMQVSRILRTSLERLREEMMLENRGRRLGRAA
jgi:RNA polymerase sigma-B factor